MAAILGISGGYHDAAAALVIDGQIVAAMQEERFSRMKNDPSLPWAAARACLTTAGLAPRALDEVVFYENPYAKLERVLTSVLQTYPRSLRQFPKALASQLGGRVFVLDSLASGLRVPRERVTFREHHASHAASAFFPSPFERAAILTIDAVGEDTSTAIWRGDENGLSCQERILFPHSLGLLYSALTAYLGFEVNEGEYKVMGLAAFGTPHFRSEFGKLIRLEGHHFELGLEYFDAHTNLDVGFSRKLEGLLGPRRMPGRPFQVPQDVDDQRAADIAATLQQVLEEAVLALAQRALALNPRVEALCLAGGVTLNVRAVARLSRELPEIALFVQPAAGDAGGALGAALIAARDRNDPRTAFTSAALGTDVSGATALSLAEALGVPARRVSDPIEQAAERLARGQLVGFARGRFEWGPRALGQRSLFALPGPASVRERLNRVIKQREPFRPFAPMVLKRECARLFGPIGPYLSPFMTSLAEVMPTHSDALAAVTHHDGTARVQTACVDSDAGKLLTAIEARTDLPVLLNTSLNGQGEPIVRTEVDALAFMLGHGIDALIVDDILIERTPRS